jgi:peroxiredoxin Q/BCP
VLDTDQQAPKFELPDENGKTVRLSDFEGRRVVLYFYPKAGTEGCTTEAKSFSDSWSEFAEHDVQVLAVSTDTVEEVAQFDAEHDFPFPLLSDENGEMARAYETFGTTEVNGETFEIAFRNTYVIGPSGTIEATYEDVSPDDHAKEVLGDVADSSEI